MPQFDLLLSGSTGTAVFIYVRAREPGPASVLAHVFACAQAGELHVAWLGAARGWLRFEEGAAR
jgi:hypothetical protein